MGGAERLWWLLRHFGHDPAQVFDTISKAYRIRSRFVHGDFIPDKHLKDAVANGDETHRSAFEDMKGRWKRPISGMGWYRSTKRTFAGLPED